MIENKGGKRTVIGWRTKRPRSHLLKSSPRSHHRQMVDDVVKRRSKPIHRLAAVATWAEKVSGLFSEKES
jgi:hypothetical protein